MPLCTFSAELHRMGSGLFELYVTLPCLFHVITVDRQFIEATGAHFRKQTKGWQHVPSSMDGRENEEMYGVQSIVR